MIFTIFTDSVRRCRSVPDSSRTPNGFKLWSPDDPFKHCYGAIPDPCQYTTAFHPVPIIRKSEDASAGDGYHDSRGRSTHRHLGVGPYYNPPSLINATGNKNAMIDAPASPVPSLTSISITPVVEWEFSPEQQVRPVSMRERRRQRQRRHRGRYHGEQQQQQQKHPVASSWAPPPPPQLPPHQAVSVEEGEEGEEDDRTTPITAVEYYDGTVADADADAATATAAAGNQHLVWSADMINEMIETRRFTASRSSSCCTCYSETAASMGGININNNSSSSDNNDDDVWMRARRRFEYYDEDEDDYNADDDWHDHTVAGWDPYWDPYWSLDGGASLRSD